MLLLRWEVVSPSSNPPNWRSTHYRLSATPFLIHSQLPSTSGCSPLHPQPEEAPCRYDRTGLIWLYTYYMTLYEEILNNRKRIHVLHLHLNWTGDLLFMDTESNDAVLWWCREDCSGRSLNRAEWPMKVWNSQLQEAAIGFEPETFQTRKLEWEPP
jgi:hypothetical protein